MLYCRSSWRDDKSGEGCKGIRKDETDRKGFLKHCRINFSRWIRVNAPGPVPVKVKDGEASSCKSLSTYVSVDWQTKLDSIVVFGLLENISFAPAAPAISNHQQL